MAEKRELILKLGQKITDRIGHKVTVDDPEYWGLACIVTDEMAEVALKMKVRKPMTFPQLLKATGKEEKELEKLLEEMSIVGLLEYNWENPQKEKQMEAVYDTLKQLGANESPIITAFNKIDLLNGDEILKDPNAEAVVRISGKNGEGTDQLLEQIEKILQKQKLYLEKLYGYQEAGKIQLIRSHGQLLKEEYRDDGIYVEAYIPKEILGSI